MRHCTDPEVLFLDLRDCTSARAIHVRPCLQQHSDPVGDESQLYDLSQSEEDSEVSRLCSARLTRCLAYNALFSLA